MVFGCRALEPDGVVVPGFQNLMVVICLVWCRVWEPDAVGVSGLET